MAKQAELPDRYSPDWLDKLDGRTRIAHVVNERLQSLTVDLGGFDNLSYQQLSLAKRAIWMEAVIEQQEAALSRGEEIDQGRLTQAVNSLIGLLKTLGLNKAAKNVPDLASYLKNRQAATQ